MKIRTNFVTNSSSYSSAEIRIDNPVLLEILKKYKELGAFNTSEWDWSCANNSIAVNPKQAKKEALEGENPFLTKSELRSELKGYKDEETAFFFYEGEQAEIFYAPNRLEAVIGCLLKVIENEGNARFENKDLYRQFLRELQDNLDEINDNYVEVSWRASNDGYGEAEPSEYEETEWTFEYHK